MNRPALIKMIHTGRRRLAWDDETYRTWMQGQVGKSSSADCTDPELSRLVTYLQEQGALVRQTKRQPSQSKVGGDNSPNILSILAEAPGHCGNSSVITNVINRLGRSITHDQVKMELLKLKAEKLVAISEVSDLLVATLLPPGLIASSAALAETIPASAGRSGRPTEKQWEYALDLSKKLGMDGTMDDPSLVTLCRNVAKTDHPRFLNQKGIGSLINALQGWRNSRQKHEQATG